MYVIHYKKATKFEDLKLQRHETRTGADAATFDLPDDRSANVVESDNDLIKNLWGMADLVSLFNQLGRLIKGDLAPVSKFHDVPTARQRVMMRLADAGKHLALSPPGLSEKEWREKDKAGAVRAASEMYLGAADDFTRKEAEKKLARLGVPTPTQERVEEHTMVAKSKKKGAAKSGATNGKVRASPKGEAYVELPRNLIPVGDMGVGLYCRSLIMLGKAAEEIVQLAKQHFRGVKTNKGHVSWYRRDLEKRGVKKVPSGRETAAAAK